MANTESIYSKLSVSDLSTMIMKGSPNSSDRDAGFCSGSSEGGDDLIMDHSRLEPSSPTDASEDSVEVKVTPISFIRNKRKSTEPSKVICEQETGPLKKRIRYISSEDPDSKIPFRPWDESQLQLPHELMPNPAEVYIRHPGVTTLHRGPIDEDVQEEPLALVAKKPSPSTVAKSVSVPAPVTITVTGPVPSSPEKKLTVKNVEHSNHKHKTDLSEKRKRTESVCSELPTIIDERFSSVDNTKLLAPSVPSSNASTSSNSNQRPQQRNYKNMTRERRIEANARERTRVHTISAAYDTLRKSIPAYSNTQKLSKLSVLRVACSYILTLSRMAGFDYSEDASKPSLAECIEAVTKTIQTEGKLRKKKDE